jgi:hypothetical protein
METKVALTPAYLDNSSFFKSVVAVAARTHDDVGAQVVSQCVTAVHAFARVWERVHRVNKSVSNKSGVVSAAVESLQDPALVGFLGCGRLGFRIVSKILGDRVVPPARVLVSCRRPFTPGLVALARQGVSCFSDNARLVAACKLVFVCCLPSQVRSCCSYRIARCRQSLVGLAVERGGRISTRLDGPAGGDRGQQRRVRVAVRRHDRGRAAAQFRHAARHSHAAGQFLLHTLPLLSVHPRPNFDATVCVCRCTM